MRNSLFELRLYPGYRHALKVLLVIQLLLVIFEPPSAITHSSFCAGFRINCLVRSFLCVLFCFLFLFLFFILHDGISFV